MRKPWVDTDPQVIVVKEYARKTAKVLVVVTLVYTMAYGAGKAIGTQAMKNQK